MGWGEGLCQKRDPETPSPTLGKVEGLETAETKFRLQGLGSRARGCRNGVSSGKEDEASNGNFGYVGSIERFILANRKRATAKNLQP